MIPSIWNYGILYNTHRIAPSSQFQVLRAHLFIGFKLKTNWWLTSNKLPDINKVGWVLPMAVSYADKITAEKTLPS